MSCPSVLLRPSMLLLVALLPVGSLRAEDLVRSEAIVRALKAPSKTMAPARHYRTSSPHARAGRRSAPKKIKVLTVRKKKTADVEIVREAGLSRIDLRVEFDFGKATLSPSGVSQIQELGKALSSPELSNRQFRLNGHTDTVGGVESNKRLSLERATTVRDYLVKSFRMSEDRLDLRGYGEAFPIEQSGRDNYASQVNRRVEVEAFLSPVTQTQPASQPQGPSQLVPQGQPQCSSQGPSQGQPQGSTQTQTQNQSEVQNNAQTSPQDPVMDKSGKRFRIRK